MRSLIYTDESHVVEIKMNGDAWRCILKEVIFHPVSDKPQHADFQVLVENEPIKMTIPVRPIGIPVGQIQGGLERLVRRSLEVLCLPKDIPEQIDLQVTDLKIGQAIHISDLEIEGVTFLGLPEQTIFAVTPPRGLTAAEEEEEEGAEGEEGEEGDEEGGEEEEES
jgi:large subunit ribosomal protein L25